MTWSDAFRAYLEQNGLSQQQVAQSLKVPQSAVSYWCRGSTPRPKTRKRIERWSRGAVPADEQRAA